MITFGIVIVTVMRFLIVSLISADFSWTEKIGLSFPIGIGVQTLLMAFLDLCGIRLTAASILSPGLLAILVIACLLFRRSRRRHARAPCKVSARPGTAWHGCCSWGLSSTSNI